MNTRRERAYLGSVALIALTTFFLSLLWAFALPYFEGPDERQHYNSVARLVDGGGWPQPYDAYLLPSTWQALGEAGWGLPAGKTFDTLAQPADRATLLGPTDLPESTRDQMVQHPPGYYLVAATAVAIAGGGDLRWDHASLLLYALSAALSAAAVPFVAGAVRRATGSRWAGVIGAIVPLAIPSYTAVGSRISNDPMLVLAVSATIYALVRAWADPRRRTWMLVLAGIAYGVALGTKGYALMLAPVVVVLAVGAAWRVRRRVWPTVWRLLVPAAIAFAIGGWWWVRNLILLGTIQPSQYGSSERRGQPVAADGYSFATFVETFFPRMNETFWDRVAYVHGGDPGWGVTVAGIALVVSLIAGLVLTRSRLMLALLLLYPVIIMATLFRNAHGIYWDVGDAVRGVQGRYLFSGIAVFALAFAALIHRLARRFPGWAKASITMIIGSAAAAAVLASMWSGVPLAWQTREDRMPPTIGDPITFMDIPSWIYVAVPVTACVLLLAGLVLGALVSVRETSDTASTRDDRRDEGSAPEPQAADRRRHLA